MTRKALKIKQAAKRYNALSAVPVKSVAIPISELLIKPAMLATEIANAKPVAAAVPFRKVPGKLKKTGTAPNNAPDAIENVSTVNTMFAETKVLATKEMAPM